MGISQKDLIACPYMQELLSKEGTQGKLLTSSIKNDKRGGLTHHVYDFQALIDNSYSVMGHVESGRGKSQGQSEDGREKPQKESKILSLHLEKNN